MTEQCEIFLSHCPTPGYAIDVGANDGLYLSNTIDLEKAGWHVLCIEPNPAYGFDLWVNRKEVVIGAVSDTSGEVNFYPRVTDNNKYAAYSSLTPHPDGFVFPVAVRTLDEYLAIWNPPQLDLLTVDVEGWEKKVLAGFDINRWKPKVICLEDWATFSGTYAAELPDYELIKMVNGLDHVYVRKV